MEQEGTGKHSFFKYSFIFFPISNKIKFIEIEFED